MSEFNFDRLQGETKFRHLVRVSVAKLNREHSIEWLKIVEMFNLDYSDETLRKKAYGWKDFVENEEIEKLNSEEEVTYKETTEILADGSHKSDKLLRMNAEQSKNIDYLLKAHGFDSKEWELVNAKNNIWNVYSKTDKIQCLYSSRITVKPKVNGFDEKEIKEFYLNLSKNYKSPVYKPIRYKENEKMLELNITDLHVGKLCWQDESGDTYNEVVAEERFFYIIDDVLNKTKDYEFEKILFVWSNDFFHFDSFSKTTTAGTPQDTNLQYAKMYKLGVKMLVQAIDLLSKIAPVETFYISSNHDKLTSYHATEYIKAWYRNNKNIKVDATPSSRKYVEFGNSLIQFSHGHAEKKRLGQTMQVEQREAWGRTIYHEVHAGHIHSEKAVTEQNGVIIRNLSSPTGTDRWHSESGYVGAVKKAQSFLWDKINGLEMIINTPIIE